MTRRRLMEGVSLLLGSAIALFFTWYAYFVLKRAPLSLTIFASLFLGCGLLVGFLSLTLKYDEPRWFRVDPKRLTRSQNFTLGIGGVIFAICSLWLAVSIEVGAFLQATFRSVAGYLLLKVAFVIAFFYFAWQAVLKFQHAMRHSHKEEIPVPENRAGKPGKPENRGRAK